MTSAVLVLALGLSGQSPQGADGGSSGTRQGVARSPGSWKGFSGGPGSEQGVARGCGPQ